jgi:hypothetical protein
MIKWKWDLGITIVALSVALAGGTWLYMKGRSDGVTLTEARFAEERLEWAGRVAEVTQQHTQDVADITSTYNQTVAKLRAEIIKLQRNPRVIETYVPVNTPCNVTQGFVDLHNTSAAGQPLTEEPTKPNIVTNKTLNQVASTIAENYYMCNETMARLEALQQLVKQYQKQQRELVK